MIWNVNGEFKTLTYSLCAEARQVNAIIKSVLNITTPHSVSEDTPAIGTNVYAELFLGYQYAKYDGTSASQFSVF